MTSVPGCLGLVELGVLADTARPWIVGITDLHVLVDILDKPAELIGYLEFRQRWLGEPNLVSSTNWTCSPSTSIKSTWHGV